MACTAQAGPTSTGSAPSATTTTTTTTIAASTSTTVVDAPVDVCGPRTAWNAGDTYVASCFLTPLRFTPIEDGWVSTDADVEWIEGMWAEPGMRQPAIRYVILAYEPQSTPTEVISSILDIEGVDARTTPVTEGTTVWVDVDTAPVTTVRFDLSRAECVRSPAAALDLGDGEPGYVLLDRLSMMEADGGELYGLGACRPFRIWAMQIDDVTITVIATTDDPDRFDELMPVAERLVATIDSGAS